MPHVKKINFNGESNLGLLSICTDKVCLIGPNINKKTEREICEILKVDLFKTTIVNTNLLGIFVAMNENGIVLPKIAEKGEIENFKKLGKNILIPKIRETAFGNLILVNDKGCVIPKNLEKLRKDLEDCFGVEVEVGSITGKSLVGSFGVATNKGLLVHRECDMDELKQIEKILKVEGDIGTANFGSPFVGAFILANSHGYLVSEQTTGPELGRIDETLGFI